MKWLKAFLYLAALFLVSELALRLAGIRPFPHFNDKATEKLIAEKFRGYMCNDDSIGVIPCASKACIIY